MAVESVAETIERRKLSGHGSLIAYLPAGFPSISENVAAAEAVLNSGADVLELGVPYSDPVMDGPVISQATHQALQGGFRLRDLFPTISKIRERIQKPILVMTYWNPVVQFGISRFARELRESGGAGFITPDLIPEEAEDLFSAAGGEGLESVFLAAPTSTDERLRKTIEVSSGFVYAVSTMGTTGAREGVDKSARILSKRLYENGAEKVCVGLGISNESQVRDVVSFADGAIVGSALVSAVKEGGAESAAKLVERLQAGTVREKPGSKGD